MGVLEDLKDTTMVTMAGDWHGNVPAAREAIRAAKAAGSTVLVHVGDFGVWPGRYGQEFLDSVQEALEENDMVLLFVDGNHEDFPQLLAYPVGDDGVRTLRPRLHHVARGTRWVWAGPTWLGLGGASSIDRPGRTEWVDWWKDEEITVGDAMRASAGRADVMVTHDCPHGVDIPGIPPNSIWDPSELLRAENHRALLGEVVEAVEPTHLFHGHFHSRYERDRVSGSALTRVVGLDRDGSGEKNWIHLDLDVLFVESLARRGE